MNIDDSRAKIILRAFDEAGGKGLTSKAISRAVGGKVCDCESWIRTFLEAGIIERCGKTNSENRYRLVKGSK